jgi:hypothetical protein
VETPRTAKVAQKTAFQERMEYRSEEKLGEGRGWIVLRSGHRWIEERRKAKRILDKT